ncbi:hypothetical protein SLA2020_277820 [Shorea laevis]
MRILLTLMSRILTRNLHKFLKSAKRSSMISYDVPSKVVYRSYYYSGSHNDSCGKNTRDRRDKKYIGVQCYECSGYVHVKANYGNLKNSKDNAMNASVSDEFESDDSQDCKGKKVVYLAIPTTVGNCDEASGAGTLFDGETFNESSQGETNDNQNFKVAYNRLYKECVDA